MALTDLTRISTSGIATGSTIDAPILRKDVSLHGSQVGVVSALFDSSDDALEFNDNVKLKLGNDGDLSLYHTGTDSYIKGSSSGQVTVDVPAAAGTNTLTVPAETGTVVTKDSNGIMVNATQPAFSVTPSSDQDNATGGGTAATVVFGTEILLAFDSARTDFITGSEPLKLWYLSFPLLVSAEIILYNGR